MFPKKRQTSAKIEQKTTENSNVTTLEFPKAGNLSKGTSFSSLLKVAPRTRAHDFTFGVVYANDLAKDEIRKEKPNFPVSSIIVREKNASETSEIPELVIAMIKRNKGFSTETNDWEFLVFNGKDLQLQKRETKGDCAACHIRSEKNDWVFRDYLK